MTYYKGLSATYYSSDRVVQLTKQDVIQRRFRKALSDKLYWFRVYRKLYSLSPARALLAAIRNRDTAFDVM